VVFCGVLFRSRTGPLADAAMLFGYAITWGAAGPRGEPAGRVREERAGLYAGRAAVRAAQRRWVDACADAECSLECTKVEAPPGVAAPPPPGAKHRRGAWLVGARALREMGRVAEARRWIDQAVLVEGTEGEEESAPAEKAAQTPQSLYRRQRGGSLLSPGPRYRIGHIMLGDAQLFKLCSHFIGAAPCQRP
jgi:hypothetical protein